MDELDDLVTGGALRGRVGADALHEQGIWTRCFVGDRVGPFKLLREIGEGGSSVVFIAERDNGTFSQRVAIKLLRNTNAAARRALTESNFLARLSHPNIARVIDAGELDPDCAWLAMDLIDGEPIDQWCRTQSRDWRQRCLLLVTVAEAVQHAHRHLLAHGDIKPGNVLVDREGKPHLLDFGISQCFDSNERCAGFTPGFASPEQRRGEPIDAASDVFQLGKLASVLLPSALEIPALVRMELRQVLARAQHVDPESRFASANELAQELARLERLSPARMLPMSPARSVRWCWLRHRRAIVGVFVLCALLVPFGYRLHGQKQAALALAEREQSAKTELARLNANLLAEAIKSVDGDQEAFRNFVHNRQAQVLEENRLDPLVKYEILSGLASAHVDIGEFGEARFAIDTALALHSQLGVRDDLGAAHLHCLRGLAAALSGETEVARIAAARSVQLLDPIAGSNPEPALRTQLCLGGTYTQLGDVAAARERIDWSVRVAQERFGKDSREYLEALSGSAELSRIWMDLKRAVRESEYVAVRMTQVYGARARRTQDQYIRLQGARAAVGEAASAERALADVIAQLQAEGRVGNYHFHAAHYYRGEALQLLGRYVEAAASYDKALELLAGEAMNAPIIHRLSDAAVVSRMQLELGRPQAAIENQRAALAYADQVHGDPISRSLLALHLADALLDDRAPQAEVHDLLESAQPLIETQFGADSFNAVFARLQQARAALADERPDVARQIADQTNLEALNLTYPPHLHLAMRWQLVRARIAHAALRPEAARVAAMHALGMGEEHLGGGHPLVALVRFQAAQLLADSNAEWAAEQIRMALPVLRSSHPPDSLILRQAEAWSTTPGRRLP